MGGTALILAASTLISVGLFIFSSRLLKKPTSGEAQQADDLRTSLSTRGLYLNYVLGTRPVQPLFGWTDAEPTTTTEPLDTVDIGGGKGGGGKGGGGEVNTTIYHARGWQMLCLGPASELKQITQDGTVIWEGSITPASTPSGTAVDTEGQGTFYIYWGEVDQPFPPSFLIDAVGVRSRWPYVCYVVWDSKRLGPNPKWPQLEYLISNTCLAVPDGIGWTPETGEGVNPASVLHQILTASYPHGSGIVPGEIEGDSLTEIGTTVGDSEQIACSFIIESGTTISEFLEEFLVDTGVSMHDHDGLLAFAAVRALADGETLPEITDDQVSSSDPEIDIYSIDQDVEITHVTFEFTDRDRAYRINEYDYPFDGLAEEVGTYQPETVQIRSVDDAGTARKIANRRIPEFLGGQSSLKYEVFGEASRFLPGTRFIDPGGRSVVALSIKPDPLRSAAAIEGLLDSAGADPEAGIDDDGDAPGGEARGPREDFAFLPFELPPSLYTGNGSSIEVVVLRIRAHEGISGASILAEVNQSGSFASLATQPGYASGGALDQGESLPSGSPGDVISSGPVIETANSDILSIPDLSSMTTEWQSGEVLLVIDEEVMYLRNISAVSEPFWPTNGANVLRGESIIPADGPDGRRFVALNDGQLGTSEPTWPSAVGETVTDNEVVWETRLPRFRLEGIIRGREGTSAPAHEAGQVAFIVRRSRLQTITSASMQTGVDLAIKSVPHTASEALPASTVEPAEITLAGAAGFGQQRPAFYTDESGGFYVDVLGDRYVHDPDQKE